MQSLVSDVSRRLCAPDCVVSDCHWWTCLQADKFKGTGFILSKVMFHFVTSIFSKMLFGLLVSFSTQCDGAPLPQEFCFNTKTVFPSTINISRSLLSKGIGSLTKWQSFEVTWQTHPLWSTLLKRLKHPIPDMQRQEGQFTILRLNHFVPLLTGPVWYEALPVTQSRPKAACRTLPNTAEPTSLACRAAQHGGCLPQQFCTSLDRDWRGKTSKGAATRRHQISTTVWP